MQPTTLWEAPKWIASNAKAGMIPSNVICNRVTSVSFGSGGPRYQPARVSLAHSARTPPNQRHRDRGKPDGNEHSVSNNLGRVEQPERPKQKFK